MTVELTEGGLCDIIFFEANISINLLYEYVPFFWLRTFYNDVVNQEPQAFACFMAQDATCMV